MVEKLEKNWNPTCNRFVAFLDIMGFEDLVSRNDHMLVLKKMEEFSQVIKEPERFAKDDMVVKGDLPYIRTVFFSDSILLVSSDDSKMSANILISFVQWMFPIAVRMKIPIKGAIAYGKQTADFDNSLHFGKPLIDAYELQNEILLYGVVLHHTMEQYLRAKKMMIEIENTDLYKYEVPIKAGKINHYIVDWLATFDRIKDERYKKDEFLRELYESVSGSPRRYVDNTISFIKWLVEYKEKRKEEKSKEPFNKFS